MVCLKEMVCFTKQIYKKKSEYSKIRLYCCAGRFESTGEINSVKIWLYVIGVCVLVAR